MGSSARTFHDGIDYRFFNDHDVPEMPADTNLAKRASPLERRVRQKLTSTLRDTDAATGMKNDEGEGGKGEDIDLESDGEPNDPRLLDMTYTFGKGSEPRSTAESVPVEGEKVGSTISLNTAEVVTQTTAGGDGTGRGVDEPGDGTEDDMPNNGDDHGDGGKTSPAASPTSPSSPPRDRSTELVGWSDLLMIDLVLAYFRYYAHRRKDYEGRTFCHRSQVHTPAVFVCFVYIFCR